jgi:hypothetical protein
MTAVKEPRRVRIPLWLKISLTLFVCALVPIYWRDYGPGNFLSFCDLGLLLTVVGLWLNSPLLISMEAVALTLPQAFWIVDFITGGRIIHVSVYMFDSSIPLFTRLLSTFHIWLPVLLIYLVWRMGYVRRAAWIQTIVAVVVLIASYVLTDPRHPPLGYPDAVVNVNRVYGIQATQVQTWMPPLLFLGLHLLFWPLFFYLPTHLIFCRIFRSGPARVQRDIDRAETNGPQAGPLNEA